MSKRFIDTGLFDDDWFMDLSKEAKILWIYFITKCNHAGILKLNPKLCKVQTGLNDINGIIRQLGNRIITVSEQLYFLPKFIEFQYPGFPNSKAKAQTSAIEILKKLGVLNEDDLTVKELLPNSYNNNNNNSNDNNKDKGISKNKYADFVSLTEVEYKKLVSEHGISNTKIFISILDNYKGSSGKKYKDDYRAILSWVIDKAKKEGKYMTNLPAYQQITKDTI
jgi:hypothetical protein